MRIHNLQTRHIGPFDLSIDAGESVGLSGPSGAGKTLLLRAIADLDPHTGDIFLDNRECRTYDAPGWRCHIALLPAESQWWSDTVGAHFRQLDQHWLTALGFEPDVLDWQVARLSTGERQRLALARLLCNQPQVLLLDEPTASLDPENTQRVERLIDEYRQQQQACVIWVSHNAGQLRRVCGRRCRVVNGKLLEEAST